MLLTLGIHPWVLRAALQKAASRNAARVTKPAKSMLDACNYVRKARSPFGLLRAQNRAFASRGGPGAQAEDATQLRQDRLQLGFESDRYVVEIGQVTEIALVGSVKTFLESQRSIGRGA